MSNNLVPRQYAEEIDRKLSGQQARIAVEIFITKQKIIIIKKNIRMWYLPLSSIASLVSSV